MVRALKPPRRTVVPSCCVPLRTWVPLGVCVRVPDETTAVAVVKAGLYGTDGSGAHDLVLSTCRALDVFPTQKLLGMASFYAAKVRP